MSGVVPRPSGASAARRRPRAAASGCRLRALPLTALARACRPRQWVKNVLVAGGARRRLARSPWPEVPERLAATFVAFCAFSSSTYLLNDLHDRDEDRLHERRRMRPIAAGEVSTRAAVATRSRWRPAGLRSRWSCARGSRRRARLPAADRQLHAVVAPDRGRGSSSPVSGGFVLRALAGGVAIDVTVSRWFLAVTSFGALFLVAGKRYSELARSS